MLMFYDLLRWLAILLNHGVRKILSNLMRSSMKKIGKKEDFAVLERKVCSVSNAAAPVRLELIGEFFTFPITFFVQMLTALSILTTATATYSLVVLHCVLSTLNK